MTSVLTATTGPGVTTVTLSRPDRLNAIDEAMVEELSAVVAALDTDPEVRAVVVTGAGRAFCAGADVGLLSAMAGAHDPSSGGEDVVGRAFAASTAVARALFGLRKPVVAAVNGVAAGAGASIAAACDFLLIAESASIAFLFARRGIVPDWGATWLLPRLVGMAKARELAYLGDTLGASEAVTAGLALRAVPDAALAAEAQALAARLAAGPTFATGHTKALLNASWEHDFAGQVAAEFEAQRRCFASADAIEGATAFLQRRPATFLGR